MNQADSLKIRRRSAYVISDFIMTSLAFFVFNIVRFYYITSYPSDIDNLLYYLGGTKLIYEQIFVPIALMGVYAISGYYNHPFPKSRLNEFMVSVYSAIVNALCIFLILLINDPTPKRRTEYMLIFILFALLLIFTYSGRLIITTVIRHLWKKHSLPQETVIIGNSPVSREVQREVTRNRGIIKYHVAAFVPIAGETVCHDGQCVITKYDLRSFCTEHNVTQLIVATEKQNDPVALEILYDLFDLGLPIKIAPSTLGYLTSSIRINDILANPFIDLTTSRMNDFERNLKRTMDVVISLLVLILLSPLLLITALAVKLSSPGPVIYKQQRIGKRHKPFFIYKFRTMVTDAEKAGPQLSSENDPRITPLGRILRKYRIDELPQFVNVLRGEMSIVGPRPEREHFILQIVKEAPYYTLVHQVKPGITSWAMVKFGYASSLRQMVERTKYDMIYISNMSVGLDIKIMIYTILTIIKGRGV